MWDFRNVSNMENELIIDEYVLRRFLQLSSNHRAEMSKSVGASEDEILGDIDNAIEYATKSYYATGESYFSDMKMLFYLSDYIEELNQRKKEIELVKKQLGEN